MQLTYEELSQKYDLDIADAELVLKNISNGTARLIVISGKIGAGKDSVAPLLLDSLNIPEESRFHDFFARPLKSEITEVCEIIRYSAAFEEAVESISERMNVSKKAAYETATFIYRDVKQGELTSGYNRTLTMRSALQHWGTGVRRAQDADYWSKKAMAAAVENLKNNKTVYITDARFPNEVDTAKDAGGVTIRLTVSPEVQAARISSRDGLEISEAARNHVSETSLDTYEDFDILVDTDNNELNTVVEIIRGSAVWQKN